MPEGNFFTGKHIITKQVLRYFIPSHFVFYWWLKYFRSLKIRACVIWNLRLCCKQLKQVVIKKRATHVLTTYVTGKWVIIKGTRTLPSMFSDWRLQGIEIVHGIFNYWVHYMISIWFIQYTNVKLQKYASRTLTSRGSGRSDRLLNNFS